MTTARYERLAEGRLGLLHLDRPGPAERRQRMLCFPHGGGGPHSFAALNSALHSALPDGFALTAVDPPGRPRTRGRPLERVTDLVDLCVAHLPADSLAESVLFGHSVGGYVACALAARLAELDRPVRAVVVSAVVPPRYLDPAMPLSAMTDQQRFEWCRGLGTLGSFGDDSRALFDLFADAIRADCLAFETAGTAPMAHRAPLLVLGGTADPMCPPAQLHRWTDTHPQAVVRLLPGGHMLPQQQADRVAEEITAFLRAPAPARPTPAGWRREDLRLRSRDGHRRCLPVLLPTGGPDTTRLAEVLSESEPVRAALAEHGALLARGWGVVDPGQLRTVAGAGGDGEMRYVGGNSPRTALDSGVYTSTEYPAEQQISPHNELSYARHWPERIYFACARPATGGGQTPLVDGRALLERIPDELVSTLEELGVCYVRTLHGGRGAGRSWQQTFETEDRDRVVELLAAAGAEAEWLPGNTIRVRERRPASTVHPGTGERVWFNQAEQWHRSTLDPEVREALLAEFGPAGLPHDATFGDGRPIPDDDVRRIRAVMAGLAVAHDWRRGDVLVVDNVATLHGRAPFTGPRRVLVAMAEPARAVAAPPATAPSTTAR